MRTRRLQSSSDPMPLQGHRPVLLHESLDILDIQPHETVLDATLGGAGHARAIVSKLHGGVFVGIDADADAITRAEAALDASNARIILIEGNFRNVESYLGKHGISRIDKVFFDLGWSSYQLDAGRGFSFLRDEPLLMTFSQSQNEHSLTASTIVNEWQEESIADVIYGWGEERYARGIARAIVAARRNAPITTSRQLAEIIAAAVPLFYRRGRIHPATRTFQALRIATNDEMGALAAGLHGAWRSLRSGGRLAVLTFHSVEDREVKRIFREWEDAGVGRRVTKKPLQASREEVLTNPRSRSAKLRCMEKF